jgi:hypothetical protein
MAKKSVATLQKSGKGYAKIIKSTRSPKTGAYTFKEEMVLVDDVKEALKR